MKNPVFLACDKCQNIVEVIQSEQGKKFECCNSPLKELEANTSEGATEKHMPVVEKNGSQITVKVGSVSHPMSEEHSIDWVYLQTEKGGQRVDLKPEDEPIAHFAVAEGDRAIAAYAFCNLHGFWKSEIFYKPSAIS